MNPYRLSSRRSWWWIASTGALLFLTSWAAEATAVDSFTGIDLVVLIDQSGSMWGHPEYHPARNDEHQHRIGEVRDIVYRLSENVEETGFVHRVSVIDFDDNASVALSVHELSFDPAEPGLALRRSKAAVPGAIRGREGVNTNTPEAMRLAISEVDKMGRLAPATGRRRIVFIVTDGRPNIPGVRQAALLGRIQAQAQELADRGVELWVVALNDADNYWNEGDGSFWESLTGPGRARLAEGSATGVPRVFQEIVDSWLEVESQFIPGDQYFCPPYLRRIVFKVVPGKPASPITVIDADGKVVSPSTLADDRIATGARYVIDDPKPGVYRIDKDPRRYYGIFVEEYANRVSRALPGAEVDLSAETRVVFKVVRRGDAPLELLPEWPIDAQIGVTPPSGASEMLSAPFEDHGAFAATWRPQAAGNYRVRLHGFVRLPDGSRRDVFAGSAHSYDDLITVTPRSPVRLVLDAPDPRKAVSLCPWTPSKQVTVHLEEAGGSGAADPGGLVPSPKSWLSVQVVDEHGLAQGAAIPMEVTSDKRFLATIPVSLNLKTIEGWWTPRRLYLRFVPQPGELRGDHYLHSLRLPPGSETRRAGSDPFSVGPLDLRWCWPMWLAVIALLVLLLAGGALLAAVRVLPDYQIRRQDATRGSVDLKVYNIYQDPTGVGAQTYPVRGKAHFKLDNQLVIRIDGQEHKAVRLRVRRQLYSRGARARLQYRWDGESKSHFLSLDTGRPKKLDGLPNKDHVATLSAR